MYVYFALHPNANPNHLGDAEFSLMATRLARGGRIETTSREANRLGFESGAIEFEEPTGADVHIFRNGQQILEGLSSYPPRSIEKLVIFAHGSPQSLGWGGARGGGGIHTDSRISGWIRMDVFIRMAGPKLTENCIVGLAGCTTGLSLRLFQEWARRRSAGANVDTQVVLHHYERGDEDSLAGVMRDGLVQYCPGIEIRAHKIRGHTTFNPNANYFRAPAGSPGIPYCSEVMGEPPEVGSDLVGYHQQWTGRFLGREATEWIIGGLGQSANQVASVTPSPTRLPFVTDIEEFFDSASSVEDSLNM